MPTLPVTTKDSKEIWKSGDGQRTIYEVTLDYNGTLTKAKTYSRAISVVGFSGDVESYEKAGRNGSETFVKQANPEGRMYKGGEGKDNSAIQAQMAIKAAVELVKGYCETSSHEQAAATLSLVEEVAKNIFVMIDRVKAAASTEDGKVADTVYDVSDSQEDIQTIKDIFGEK